MKRVAAIAAIGDLLVLGLAFHTSLKNFLFGHQWLLSTLAAAPALVFAFLEYRHFGEANSLRREANEYREEANAQRREANEQRERANQALAQIAAHTKRVPTRAERNAERLQRYLGAKVEVVNADDSRWVSVVEIVGIDNEVVTLFTPAGSHSSSARADRVHCDYLEIVDGPVGGAALALKVLKRYGISQDLGQIKSWGERNQLEAAPVFSKGENVFNAEYLKPGSPERRRMDIFESADGRNFYMLVANPGDSRLGDNVGISRHFMLIQIEWEAQGFRYNGGGSSASKHPLFMKTRA
jgi:hypothetical protein